MPPALVPACECPAPPRCGEGAAAIAARRATARRPASNLARRAQAGLARSADSEVRQSMALRSFGGLQSDRRLGRASAEFTNGRLRDHGTRIGRSGHPHAICETVPRHGPAAVPSAHPIRFGNRRGGSQTRFQSVPMAGAVTPPWPQSAVGNLMSMPLCLSLQAQFREGQVGGFRTGHRPQEPVVEVDMVQKWAASQWPSGG